MINTRKYRTRTEFIERENGKLPGVWLIALDNGYSGVKLYSPNLTACFPSYAKRVGEDFEFATKAPKESILYKNLDTNEQWLVGELAQNSIASGDTSDSESALYGRERYTNAMYQVISDVGLGLGMQSNQYGAPGKDRIVVQAGLPEKYLGDEPDLIDSIAGKHRFALKIGSGDWTFYDFTIASDDVYVMSQPKGTLFSVCIDKNGQFHPEAQKYLTSSILVFDPGFGTLDLFPIMSGIVGHGETYSDLGMKRVLQETSRLIKEAWNIDVPVPSMQKNLETGTVRYVNKKEMVSKEYQFADLLAQANQKVCNEAINRMNSAINLIDYNYFIVTGGTGAAWLPIIQERFKDYSTLKIICGNQNDDLAFIYNNVRGFFYFRFNKLGKELRG